MKSSHSIGLSPDVAEKSFEDFSDDQGLKFQQGSWSVRYCLRVFVETFALDELIDKGSSNLIASCLSACAIGHISTGFNLRNFAVSAPAFLRMLAVGTTLLSLPITCLALSSSQYPSETRY